MGENNGALADVAAAAGFGGRGGFGGSDVQHIYIIVLV